MTAEQVMETIILTLEDTQLEATFHLKEEAQTGQKCSQYMLLFLYNQMLSFLDVLYIYI